jgi:hypothetical protein
MIQNFFKAAIFIVLVYACNPNNVKNDTAIAQRSESTRLNSSHSDRSRMPSSA